MKDEEIEFQDLLDFVARRELRRHLHVRYEKQSILRSITCVY